MAKRRKFLAGLGALASGSAAAVGTGALSQTSAERQLNGRVAADANGYTQIKPGGHNSDGNEHFVETKSNGEIFLNFDQNGEGGEGLAPDSLSMFENVFNIMNFSKEGPKRYYIERDGPNMDRIEFFNTGDGIDPADYYSITGGGGGSAGDSVLQSKATSTNEGGYNQGALDVSVQIDLRDVDLSAGDSLTDLFGEEDNFLIVAEQPQASQS
ncbi:hypothetical protein EKH57_00040 (plasmid) [Halorubrum sp. BOL3-1]|uniref:hypothetical protein n=1 Tax=Halorubrum sp. BOL3-1 TaxID=2497325 RepID=UPI0010051901|nr:hypothetical protein [Halorubrum sp. BOL3-1]QAU11323.1 hypothetical protein EKH57_00040 [Halorubrum sp. BOL3-1]